MSDENFFSRIKPLFSDEIPRLTLGSASSSTSSHSTGQGWEPKVESLLIQILETQQKLLEEVNYLHRQYSSIQSLLQHRSNKPELTDNEKEHLSKAFQAFLKS